MNFISALKMNCRQATFLHQKKKEGKLSAMESFGLWWHTSIVCSFCRLFLKQIDFLTSSSQRVSVKQPPLNSEKKQEINERFSRFMKE
ncbi:MAG: hypothetical protein U0V74_08815 [Chitinophagales bacterium]